MIEGEKRVLGCLPKPLDWRLSPGSLDLGRTCRWLRPRRGVIIFFVAVFSLAAIFLLYDGVVTGNYLLVVLVLAAYTLVLMFEVSLSTRTGRPPKSSK
jgi:hypothetical protein